MNNITKYLKFISLIIGVIGAYFFIKILSNGGDDATVGMFIGFTKWVLIITAIIVLIFTLINLVKNPKALKKALFAVVGLGIVYAIAYAMSKGNEFGINTAEGMQKVKSSTSKLVGTGIRFSMILGAIAFIGFVFDTVKNLIK